MPRIFRLLALSVLGFSLAACATTDMATRSAPLEVPGFQQAAPSFDVTELRVRVPKSLRVSEANVYYPVADIVWRGEPMGNRHQQITQLVGTAFQEGTQQLEGIQPVLVDVEVTRFHSLTEKARYTIGGVHSIRFNMTVRDAATGAVIVPTRKVIADLDALGGRVALAAEANGITQKSRIHGHLVELIKLELTRPLVATGAAPEEA
ncbi:MAG: DUF6778 family protein [Pseudomonadota bacterium]